MSEAPRDWDATTYERVSAPQEGWALQVLERLELRGDEAVLDAGCGSGRVTRHLIERLPRGRVIAVDASPSMIEQVREILRPVDEAIVCDLLALALPDPVDAIFSSATLHWVLDHDRLFAVLHAALMPGGRIEAQCGGRGNVAEFLDVCREVAAEPPFAAHFEGWVEPWIFAGPDETERRLAAAGFSHCRAWLSEGQTDLPEADARRFMRAICLAPHLERLPDELQDAYLDTVRKRLPDPNHLGYVRLNISAVA